LSLSIDQVRWIAHLARLELKPEELESSASQLSAILNHINELQKVNTDSVEPMAHALDLFNVFRPDELKPSLPVDEALENAPDRKGNFYGVPAVLDL